MRETFWSIFWWDYPFSHCFKFIVLIYDLCSNFDASLIEFVPKKKNHQSKDICKLNVIFISSNASFTQFWNTKQTFSIIQFLVVFYVSVFALRGKAQSCKVSPICNIFPNSIVFLPLSSSLNLLHVKFSPPCPRFRHIIIVITLHTVLNLEENDTVGLHVDN